MKTLSLSALLLYGLAVPASSAEVTCDYIERDTNDFNKGFNSTKSYKIPAFRTKDPVRQGGPRPIEKDEGKEWTFIVRGEATSGNDMMALNYLDIGDSNGTNIELCLSQGAAETLGTYQYSEEVLRRSIDDKGDCRTMLGSECVDALVKQRNRDIGGSRDCTWSLSSFPSECNGLFKEAQSNLGGNGFSTSGNLSSSVESIWKDKNCTSKDSSFKPKPDSIQSLGGMGGRYNATIRFPRPTFFTFRPPTQLRYSSGEVLSSAWSQTQLLCVRPDEIQEGSETPPTGQEILDEDIKYSKNATAANDKNAAGLLSPHGAYLALVIAAIAMLL